MLACSPTLVPLKFVPFSSTNRPSEERYNEAEQLSLAIRRVRSLGSLLGSARQSQVTAALREDFEEAKMFRDEAHEVEAWIGQAVRDASVRRDFLREWYSYMLRGLSHSHR